MNKGTILILGNPGAGKSFLARKISEILSMPIIELDMLFWGRNWSKFSSTHVHNIVKKKVMKTPHIVEGQYPEMRNTLPKYADTIIFIDFPLPLLFWRLLKRSTKRAFTGESTCHGNKETFRKLFFSKHSMIYYIFQVYSKNRYDNLRIIRDARKENKETYILKNSHEILAFIDNLKQR